MSVTDRPTLQFTRPVRPIVMMVLFSIIVGALGWWLFEPIRSVFAANVYLNGLIIGVFFLGVAACFRSVFRLMASVSWIEGFAIDRPGHEFVKAPTLLASLSALLSDQRARRSLTALSTRSILDSIATRLDESRDITRYIVNLLIFLGLLGTFWGLANTVPAVVDTIRSLVPEEGEDGIAVFDKLIKGLESQLGGMGTAFASSLLGLAGSLVVGLLELLTGHAQNRFYRELEEWLSSITRIHASGDGEGAGSAYLSALLEQNAEQLEGLNRLIGRAEERREESEAKFGDVVERIGMLAEAMAHERETLQKVAVTQQRLLKVLQDDETGRAGFDRLIDSQNAILDVMRSNGASQLRALEAMAARGADGAPAASGGGVDEETRRRIRNMDVQLLRILEEMSAGRQDAVGEIRAELKLLARTVATLADRR
jgi:hypothetical protein